MNTFGRIFRVSIYGESHGPSCGVLIDGIQPGIQFNRLDLARELERRKPNVVGGTLRKETDECHIMSGVKNDVTTGMPILLMFENQNTISQDYKHLLEHPRPGHADYTAHQKYHGFQDNRGGGHFSGRLTTGIVAAGYFAKKMIPFHFKTKIVSVFGETDESKWDQVITHAQELGDSVGGVVEICVSYVPAGLGEPYFDSLESTISHILFSIGGVKGIEFGTGFSGETLYGSEFNDCMIKKDGTTATNHAGGINGGISNGNEIVIRVFIKPTSSIFKAQETYHFASDKIETLEIKGRHDVAIVRRVPVVLENAVAIALCDAYLLWKTYQTL